MSTRTGERKLIDATRRAAVAATGQRGVVVARPGAKGLDAETIRVIEALRLGPGYQPLQNRDGTLNR